LASERQINLRAQTWKFDTRDAGAIRRVYEKKLAGRK
jgi:hypothetical protein